MLATSARALPVGPEWSYELKFDGYRAIAVKTGGDVTIYSRRLNNLTARFPSVVRALAGLRGDDCVLDGELVALDDAGRPSFQTLQNAAAPHVVFYAFDVLRWRGEDLTSKTLDTRRGVLSKIVSGSQVLLSEALPGSATEIERAVRGLGLEGVVAKRRQSRYTPGLRTTSWIKVRFNQRQEFVVGGFKPNSRHFESLVVGYYEARQLQFAAKVRAGFTPAIRTTLFTQLEPAVIGTCPFANLPQDAHGRWGEGVTAEDMKDLRWVRPRLVIEVAFVEWTNAGVLRHPSFVSVREDKAARDVHRAP